MRVSSISKEFSCPICLELMVKTRTLQCGHSFCAGCVESSLATKRQVFERITSQWKIKLTIHPVMQTWSARHVSAESCASQVDRLQLIMSFLSSFRKTHWLRMRCVCSQCESVCVPMRVDPDQLLCVQWESRKQEYENRLEHQKITAEKLAVWIGQIIAVVLSLRVDWDLTTSTWSLIPWLQRVVETAKQTQRKFLDIRSKWSVPEKKVFKKGVTLYRGTSNSLHMFFSIQFIYIHVYCYDGCVPRAGEDRIL